ncbi:unnamed protein product [Strongylus vulgaris]|uniref:Uncharacterized protein n=1 Tax=Strongylus vulgaris TaxID=40348 RepID=A0A3P7LDX5_STRVU|nr:unnamed protein product [Strongylus vulgaris]
MMESSHVDTVLRNVLQEVLSDVEKKLREDIDKHLKLSRASNEQKLKELTAQFEHVFRQKQYSHEQELLELQGSVEYLQETLTTTREQKERLEQELEDANVKLLETSEEMGSIRAEVSDLRKEVQVLRAYRDKHMREVQNLDQLQKRLEDYQAVNRYIRQEFAKVR